MSQDVQGLEEHQGTSPVCIRCNRAHAWPGRMQCHGCLVEGGKPADTYSLRTVHWDIAAIHQIIRRKKAQWEQACPGWELVPDMQRYWEASTHPSKYVDRETSVGRKEAWTRFRVERAHPRGRGSPALVRLTPEQIRGVIRAPWLLGYPPATQLVMPAAALETALTQWYQEMTQRLWAKLQVAAGDDVHE